MDFQHPGGRSCSRARHWSFHGTELSAAGWCCGHQKHGHLPPSRSPAPHPWRRRLAGGPENSWNDLTSTVPRCSADVFSWCSAFCRNPPGRRADLGKWRGLLVRSTDSPCQSTALWRCCWRYSTLQAARPGQCHLRPVFLHKSTEKFTRKNIEKSWRSCFGKVCCCRLRTGLLNKMWC